MKFVCGPRHGQDVPPGLSNSLQDVIDVTDVRWQNMPADDPVLTCQYTRRWFRINDRHVQFFGDVSSTEQDIHAAAAKMFNPVLDPVVAPVARLLWPLGINPDMDQHAAQQGLSH